jgi:hypothetical protein
MQIDAAGQTIELIVVGDGKQAWEKAGDKMQEMAKDKLAEFQHMIYTMHLGQLIPLKDKTFTLTALGESKIGERPVLGVKVSRKGRRDVKLFFDKETGLLAKNETRTLDEFTGKEVTQEAILTDYKDVSGQKRFHKLTLLRAGKLFVEEEFSDQQSHEKLDPKLFAKP